jgi:hypothetical protein
MYPIGHIAISYIVAWLFARSYSTFVELAALTAGTLFPAASNKTLLYISVFGINHYWSHSPLLLVPLGLLGIVSLWTPFSFRRVPLYFVLGIFSHLVADVIFDFPLIYLSNSVDENGPWLFPWQPFRIHYLGQGVDFLPWVLIIEGAFLAWAVWMWRRWDLAVYGVIVSAVTITWLIWRDGRT